jgi:hypothetical protein
VKTRDPSSEFRIMIALIEKRDMEGAMVTEGEGGEYLGIGVGKLELGFGGGGDGIRDVVV